MQRVVFVALFIVTAVFGSTAQAERYDVTVTRRESNYYTVSGGQFVIQTRYCYSYVYGEPAILDWSGNSGSLVFLNAGGRCDVRRVLARADQAAGRFAVTVSREGDNWYELTGTSMFAKTSLCLDLALGEDAVLDWNGYGGALVFLDNGNRCVVEGLWTLVR